METKAINNMIRLTISLSSLLLIVSCGTKQENTKPEADLVFAKGQKNSTSNFKGEVWLNTLVDGDTVNQNSVGSVTFKAGARTKWHSHPAGQIILAISGEGYYQEKGGPKKTIRKGEVAKCPPNIAHWHGASSNSDFVQVAITGREKGPTVWLDHVTDSEYESK